MQAIPVLFSSLFSGAAATGAVAAATTASTLSTITTGLQVVAAVGGMLSSSAQANYQAQVANNNAVIAEQNAQQASTDAQKEAQQRGIAAQVEMGQLLANQSANGLNLGSGSYALARKSQAELAAKDAQIIFDEGNRRVENFKQQGADFRNEASQAKAKKKYAFLEGGINILSSAVSGADRVNKLKSRKYA